MFAKRHFSFTFMEMIAVMVIIILLTTILLPVVFKGKEWAKSIKCKANMKTISDGVFAYINDYQGFFPVPGGYRVGASWTFLLKQQGYVAAPKNFVYTWTSGSNYLTTGLFNGYPADYDSVWACPSQEIAPQNRFLSNIVFGNPDYSVAGKGFMWTSCHYGFTQIVGLYYNKYGRLLQLLYKKGTKAGLLIESNGAVADQMGSWTGYWNYSGTRMGINLIWARHFGLPYGVTNQNYNSSTYLSIGPTQLNTIFIDGHSEAWSNMLWWNKYYGRFGYGGVPFSLN